MVSNSDVPVGSRGELLRLVELYANDRLNFVGQVLGVTLEPWQAKVLKDIDAGATRISIKSGHGVGKTTLLSWLMVHFILHSFPCKCVVTAPTRGQLFDGAFSEMTSWIKKLPPVYQEQLDVTSERVALRGAETEAFITARTARSEKPEALQGIHADFVLLVIDEASGVDEPIFESARGSMSTKGAITIMASNPTKRAGTFYNSHTKNAARWNTYTVSCFDSSRVDASFISDAAADYGVDSQYYAIRVLGQFPPEEDDVFLPFHLIDDAMSRNIEPIDVPFTFGVDVARFGDDSSVLCKRQGMYVHPLKVWNKLDTMQLASRLLMEYKMIDSLLRPAEIFVDAIGVGAGVADRLRQLMREKRYGCEIVDINVSESPSGTSNAHRLRDELWINLKQAAETRKLVLPRDERLLAELTTPKYEFTTKGEIKIESKAMMKKRGLKSPDAADAVGISFAHEHSIAAGMSKAHGYGSPNDFVDNSWVL